MGTSSGTQTTQQNSQTSPWAPAQPALQNILGNVGNLQSQSGITPSEQSAISALGSNAGGIPNFGPTVSNTAASYLGADPYGVLKPAYQNSQSNLAGLANPNNLNPFNTPGFSQALGTLNQDITNQVNDEFAANGRANSGLNTQTLARGLSQGEGALLQGQYNQNVQNLLGANSQLFGNATGLNAGLGQNVQQGIASAGLIPTLATQGPQAQLAAGQTPFNLLAGNQGILAGLSIPIAGLGGQTQSQGQTNTSYSPSLLQDITGGAQAFGNIFGGGGGTAAANFASMMPKF